MKLFAWILLFVGLKVVKASVEAKRIECVSLDEPFVEFEYCHIKKRSSHNFIEVKGKLYKLPVNNVTVNFSIMRNNGGYKPFLYSITVDACKFLKNRKRGLVAYFYSFIERNSNINHSCPYNHDIIVDKLDTQIENSYGIKYLPLPNGEYAISTTWNVYNKTRARIYLYFTHQLN